MQRRNVLFAIPSLTYATALECTGSLFQTAAELIKLGIPNSVRFRGGNTFIDVVRNLLVQDLLDAHEYTDIFFIDDDVGFEPHKAIELILSPKDIICGVYPKKNDELVEFPAILAEGPDGMPVREGALYKAMNIPGGFLRVKRHVLEKMVKIEIEEAGRRRALLERLAVGLSEEEVNRLSKIKEYLSPTYKFFDKGLGEREVCNLFEIGPREGCYWGEDSLFTKKAIDAGFDVWVDPSIHFTHRGQKRWEGVLQDSIDVYVERLKAGTLPKLQKAA